MSEAASSLCDWYDAVLELGRSVSAAWLCAHSLLLSASLLEHDSSSHTLATEEVGDDKADAVNGEVLPSEGSDAEMGEDAVDQPCECGRER